jgi:hypothetical protein
MYGLFMGNPGIKQPNTSLSAEFMGFLWERPICFGSIWTTQTRLKVGFFVKGIRHPTVIESLDDELRASVQLQSISIHLPRLMKKCPSLMVMGLNQMLVDIWIPAPIDSLPYSL